MRTVALSLPVFLVLVCALAPGALAQGQAPPPRAQGARAQGAGVKDFVDPTYGGRIRQIRNPDGHAHNFYYNRNPWNADDSLMLGIWTDPQQKNWQVVLYDGEGRFIKSLFSIEKYDWRLCWDRNNPDILYTWKGSDLFRYNVKTGEAASLKSFAPLFLKPNGPSVNQDGDRILVITSDNVFRSYRLPDMGEERTFTINVPAGCNVDWGKPRYTGYRNCIDTAYAAPGLAQQAIVVYDDTGAVVRKFDSIGGGGHYDYSPDGKLAYFKMSRGRRTQGGEAPLEICVASLDSGEERAHPVRAHPVRVLYSAPREKTAYVQNLHLAWPSRVKEWFIASFFPSGGNVPPSYAPLLDEIVQIRMDGTHKFLARSGTMYSRAGGRGAAGDMFWAQPLARPSADGTRICFNSNQSGVIEQCILFLDDKP